MKVGFIGTGRMGQAMVRRMLEAKHEVGVYNRTAEKAKPLADAGAKILPSIADATRFGDVIYTMRVIVKAFLPGRETRLTSSYTRRPPPALPRRRA